MAPDFSRISDKLYVGSEPHPDEFDYAGHGFNVIVFCAEEVQPPKENFPGLDAIIRIPLVDQTGYNEEEWASEWATAMKGAHEVAKRLAQGDRVLVTCRMGWNRSPFVAALTLWLMNRRPGWWALNKVRERRKFTDGTLAIGNVAYAAALLTLPAPDKKS